MPIHALGWNRLSSWSDILWVCLSMNLDIGPHTTRRHSYSVHTKIAKTVQLLIIHLNVNRFGSSSISTPLLLADDQAGLDRTHEMSNLPHGGQSRPWDTATESPGARGRGHGRTLSNQGREWDGLDDFGRITAPFTRSFSSCPI